MEQGATYTTNALGSFSDPDGDPLTLVSATPQNTDQVTVSTRADGQLVFNAGSMSSGRAGIEVTVSDGQQTGTGMVYFSVKPANTLAAVIDPAVKQTTPDTRTTIALKQYVHGTSAEPAQLTAVETPSGASTTMNATDMSFTFSASNPGTYYVPYTITQGSIPSTGLARIEVQAVTGDSAKPIAANDVALLGADNTAIVEPLSNDVDPMGGVPIRDQRDRRCGERHQNRRRKQQARLHHRTTGTDRARADHIQRRQRGRHVNRRDRTAATGTDHLQLRAESRQHHHAGTH